jgi:hypothetical protein
MTYEVSWAYRKKIETVMSRKKFTTDVLERYISTRKFNAQSQAKNDVVLLVIS